MVGYSLSRGGRHASRRHARRRQQVRTVRQWRPRRRLGCEQVRRRRRRCALSGGRRTNSWRWGGLRGGDRGGLSGLGRGCETEQSQIFLVRLAIEMVIYGIAKSRVNGACAKDAVPLARWWICRIFSRRYRSYSFRCQHFRCQHFRCRSFSCRRLSYCHRSFGRSHADRESIRC